MRWWASLWITPARLSKSRKPIKEGYKFFVLETIRGFVFNFTADERTATKNNQNKYKESKESGNIESMPLFITNVITTLEDKQKEHIDAYDQQMGT